MSNPELTPEDLEEARGYFVELVDTNVADTRFKPGESGNKMGRPKEPDNLVDMLTLRLGKAGSKKLADTLIALATEHKSLDAIKYIYDRIEGRPRQAVLQQSEEEPILVRLLRGLVDDRTALEGRSLPRQPAQLPDAIDAEEVREVPG